MPVDSGGGGAEWSASVFNLHGSLMVGVLRDTFLRLGWLLNLYVD